MTTLSIDSDFLKTWDNLEIHRIFDDEWAFNQLWLVVDCGDYSKPLNYGDVSCE